MAEVLLNPDTTRTLRLSVVEASALARWQADYPGVPPTLILTPGAATLAAVITAFLDAQIAHYRQVDAIRLHQRYEQATPAQRAACDAALPIRVMEPPPTDIQILLPPE